MRATQVTRMFSFFNKTVPEISIFHNAKSPASTQALQALRNSLTTSSKPLHFNLDVVEGPPTSDQIRTIMSYSNGSRTASSIFLSSNEQVENPDDIIDKHASSIKWPIVVDWNAGVVSVGSADSANVILDRLRKEEK